MKRLLLMISYLLIFAPSLFAADRKLSVTGNSSVFKLADKLTIVLGVETYDKESRKAVEENAIKMKSLIEAFTKTGLTVLELKTKDFILVPQMTPKQKNPPPDWQPSIAGYQVLNTVDIYTPQIETAGEIIDTASKVGGNYVQSIIFSLQDDERAKIEAIGKAFNQADTYARALAKDAGLRLGDISELSIGNSYVTTRSFKAEGLGSEVKTPISPRDIEVTASVSVVYYIETQE